MPGAKAAREGEKAGATPDGGSAGTLVSWQWLARQRGAADLVVLDATVLLAPPRFDGDYGARSGAERFTAGHIPGARHADLLQALSDAGAATHFAHLEPAPLGAALAQLGIERATRVVAYDTEGGFWSARLWWVLQACGIAAHVLDGGFAAWKAAGQPIATGAPQPWQAREPWAPEARAGAWIDQGDVEEIVLGRRPGQLVCALGPDSFAGRVPSRYARRGHIPGSLNIPAHSLFGPDLRYLDPERIRAAFGTVLDTPVRPIALYCGGGISAAASALALALVGETQVAIYDGSLEEWSAQAHLPLETAADET